MTHDRHKEPGADRPHPAEQRTLAALANLPRPRASNEVRERTRAAFLRGDLPVKEHPIVGQRRRVPWVRGILPLAAALAAVTMLMVGLKPAGTWFITDLVGPGEIQVQAGRLEAGGRVTPGTIMTGPESELELQLDTSLRFRMLPGTCLELPTPPGRWLGRSRILRLEQGEIYGTSGEQRLGFSLTFETTEITAELTGTTFAVFRTDVGTCVCLWQGGIQVIPRGGEPVTVPAQMKFYVYNDGRPADLLPIDDMERMKLDMMHTGGLAPLPAENR